ncbi:helix-turn-helix transcriptional regulator [Streptomyces sp. TRM49041]|uniref:helix-turn-helix domain-containing protein n=1 Tax=Streptomyces sp. TRM49041 TaxID=2603216 RepID=UPI0021CCAF6C|nr:helix-turn-helix transcriptional regulator [Streptomyces sp. TRM49041]
MRPREAWRQAHGWSLQQVADRVNDVEATRPEESVAADASLVGKWEKWPSRSGRRPSVAAFALLAKVYGCTTAELIDVEDRRVLRSGDLRMLTAVHQPEPETPQAPHPSPLPAPEPQGPELVRQVAEESAAWAQWAETSNVGDLALEQMMADVRELSRDYLTDDPQTVFRRTVRHRDRVFHLLEGRQYPRQSAELYTTAGYLCGLLAWMSSDLGRLAHAETQGRTAWLCAELSGQSDLRAWVLSTRSKVAFWDGRLRDAITHARRGAEYQPGGTAAVLLACQEADAWSQLGSRREAEAALGRAAEARAAITDADDVAGLFSCPRVRQVNYTAAVHLRLGDAVTALREVDEALTAQPSYSYGTAAQMNIAQASARLALHSVDGAAEALRPVLALPPDQRLAPVTNRLRELAAALAHSPAAGTRAAAELQEHIEQWCLESLPRTHALSPGDC